MCSLNSSSYYYVMENEIVGDKDKYDWVLLPTEQFAEAIDEQAATVGALTLE